MTSLPPEFDLADALRFAADLAAEAARMAHSLLPAAVATLKADLTHVTDADYRVQEMIVAALRRRFPGHGILAEEASPLLAEGERLRDFLWAVDPIDGTRNYAAGIPIFTCSLALLHRGEPVAAAVVSHEPRLVFTAASDGPAELNGRPVRAAPRPPDPNTVIALTGSQTPVLASTAQRWFLRYVLRDFGSLALHLAMVSAGMLDAAIGMKGRLWDIAAGWLLVRQAGGHVTALDELARPKPEPLFPLALARYRREPIPFLAASPALAETLQRDLASAAPPDAT